MPWTIVLAGGTGSRLADECRLRYGYARPKQFCDFDGTGTLLDHTLNRARAFSPPGQIVVVTARAHRIESDEVLGRWDDVIRVEQPRARDTTPALAQGVLAVLARDPHADVIVMPSDHHVADGLLFARALRQALDALVRDPHRIALLGAIPDGAADGYGWVLPDATHGGFGRVRSFVEKPTEAEAARLRTCGALVNTLVTVARASVLAAVLARFSPTWWRALRDSRDVSTLDLAYEELPNANFSFQVLEQVAHLLCLVPLDAAAGWSDVGTPSRLALALGTQDEPRWTHVAK